MQIRHRQKNHLLFAWARALLPEENCEDRQVFHKLMEQVLCWPFDATRHSCLTWRIRTVNVCQTQTGASVEQARDDEEFIGSPRLELMACVCQIPDVIEAFVPLLALMPMVSIQHFISEN